jgi:carbamoyltransferase
MRVLGISPLDKDSTVTIVEDGKITYAASEERFTRVKLQDGFPWQALDAGLSATGIAAGDFDAVTYPS